MSDGVGGEGGAGAGALGGGGGGAVPEWMGGLPDDLKSDATLSRYADVSALARGHIETKRLASSRVVLPGDWNDEAGRNAFYDAIGRPASAADYKIDVPDGTDKGYAEGFRPLAHQLGLLPHQVEGLVKWNNDYAASAQTQMLARGAEEMAALKAELGAQFEPRLAAAKAAAKAFGVQGDIADALDTKLGSRKLVEIFMNIGEKMGEHQRVDGGGGDFGVGGDPDQLLAEKGKDKTWRDRAKIEGTPENIEYNRLVEAATRKEIAKAGKAA